MRQDYTSPEDTKDTPIEQAMTLFVQWAKRNNRNYLSDMVRTNLANYLAAGKTPQQAVDALVRRAP